MHIKTYFLLTYYNSYLYNIYYYMHRKSDSNDHIGNDHIHTCIPKSNRIIKFNYYYRYA